jgi:ATP-dependent DNA helicase RecQ
MVVPGSDEIERIARERFGVSYLYPIQRFVVSNVLEGNPQIVVLPTGAGKSLCFLLPSLLLDGPSLVILPLRALLADQARKLRALGVPLGTLAGGMGPAEKERLWGELRSGRTRLVLATLESCLVAANLASLRGCGIEHLVVDEAHCISEWGDTFRPAYLQVGSLARGLGIRMVSAFTATASREVLGRIRAELFPDGDVRLVGENADRPGISYSVQPVLGTHGKNGLLRSAERPLLVFCRTRGETELASRSARRLLGDRAVFFYHAGLSREERAGVEAWFLGSRDGILFATCAYGMGVDKPDIRTVAHTRLPGSVEDYLQESGRAGRDGRPARAVLLFDRVAEEARRRRITDQRSRIRYERMFSYASRGDECRRAVLLSLIGQDPVACAGCDVCDGSARVRADGEDAILRFAARHRRRFTPAQAAQILCATRGPGALRRFHDCLPGSGALAGWTPAEAQEAIRTLAAAGRLRLPRQGPWKGRLNLPRTPC